MSLPLLHAHQRLPCSARPSSPAQPVAAKTSVHEGPRGPPAHERPSATYENLAPVDPPQAGSAL